MNKVTLADIARKLGVSTALVSMVLSGNGPKYRIGQKTIENVIETANRLGYNPNMLARGLRTGKTKVLGLIVADISNPFFATLARLLENEAYAFGYDVMFASSDEDPVKFNKLGDTFLKRQLDGLIIVPVMDSKNAIIAWQSSGIPIVSIDRYFETLNIPYIVTDNFDASFQMVKHVARKGYKKIAFIARSTNLSSFTEREYGFISGTNYLNLTTDQFSIFKLDNNNWDSEMELVIKKIIPEKYDIIFFSQNMLGIQGLRILKMMKIRIPEDIAVISYDNPDVFEFNSPTITCFEQPLDKLAREAIFCMVNMINGTPKEMQTFKKIKGRLVIRESC